MSGIGGSKPGEKAKLRERLNIKIGSRNENQANIDGFFEIDAWKVPVITNPVGLYNLKKDWNLNADELADVFPQSRAMDVDILIGSDYYNDFVGSPVRKLNDGNLKLTATKIGQVITGKGTDEREMSRRFGMVPIER